MKLLCFLGLLIVVTISERLNEESPDCKIYINKFDNLLIDYRVSVNQTTNEVTIDFKYDDSQYFNDIQYFGLVAEDGKPLESTCLDLKLLHNSRDGSLESFPAIFSPSLNNSTQKRILSFKMTINDLQTNLIECSNNTFNGTFQYQFVISQSLKLYQFELSIQLDKPNGIIQTAIIIPQNYQKSVNFCTDLTCSSYINNPEIFLTDLFFVELRSQDSSTQFSEVSVVYSSLTYGLYDTAEVIQSDFSQLGSAKIQLEAEIAFSDIVIILTAKLVSGNSTRILQFWSQVVQFKPLNFKEVDMYNDLSCTIQADSLYFNQYLILKQLLAPTNIVTDAKIHLEGNNFKQQVKIIYAEFMNAGVAKYLINIDNVGNNLHFLIESITNEGNITTQSENITCIKRNKDSILCPTCLEQCEINGFNEEGCESCDQLFAQSACQLLQGFIYAIVLALAIIQINQYYFYQAIITYSKKI